MSHKYGDFWSFCNFALSSQNRWPFLTALKGLTSFIVVEESVKNSFFAFWVEKMTSDKNSSLQNMRLDVHQGYEVHKTELLN